MFRIGAAFGVCATGRIPVARGLIAMVAIVATRPRNARGDPLFATPTSVTGWMRLGAVRDLVAGVPVIRRAKAARSDPLLQLFHFEFLDFEFVVHLGRVVHHPSA